MNGRQSAIAVIDALAELAIPYMLVGSLASSEYGIPRSTEDADFVVELGTRSMPELARRLGPAFRLDPQTSFETFTGTTRYELTVPEILFRIEIFLLGPDDHDQERFRRRRMIAIEGRRVSILTVEDVLVTKLRWARVKDREDVRDVIAVQGEGRIDWDYVHSWTERHGTTGLLEEIRRSIPPI